MRATVAGLAKMHLGQCMMPCVGVFDGAGCVVSRQRDEPKDGMHAMHDPRIGALSLKHAEQHSRGLVELALVGHGEAEVVAGLSFLALEFALDRDLEVLVGVSPALRKLPAP